MVWNKYPYTNMHELNLDWILAEIMKLHHDYDEFKAVNEITNAGAWDITKQYQAWTIVSDNNLGYISLKPVPKGVAITNTDYWGLVADYNILITNLSARIAALEDAVSLMTNRRYVFLGDSYNYTGGGWITGVVSGLGLPASDYFDITVSGHGFTTAGGDWLSDLTSWVGANPDELDTITDVVCVGGINDASDTALTGDTLVDAVNAFVSYVEANIPHAKVTMCFVGNARSTSAVLYTRDYKNRLEAANRIQWVLDQRGHVFNESCMYALYDRRYLDPDGLHPSVYGQTYGIIPAVVAALKGSDFIPRHYDSTNTFPSIDSFREIVSGGKNKLQLAGCGINQGITVVDSAWTDVYTLPSSVISSHHDPVLAVVENRDLPDTKRYHCLLRVVDGVVQAKMSDTANAGAYESFTSTIYKAYIQFAEFVDDIQNSI